MSNFDYINRKSYLQEKAKKISKQVFVGGGVAKFEQAGRGQLISLLQVGIYPHSKLLDVGCGCLRGGYWLIHFLNKACYHGIEPNMSMLASGIQHILEPEVLKEKAPRFDSNENYNFSCFGVTFDFVIARSVWTHAPKCDIEFMLDQFIVNSSPEAVFITTYLAPGFRDKEDYTGGVWVGKSHQCNKPGTVAHDFAWIAEQCSIRNLIIKEPLLFEHGEQRWLYITKQ